jgi:hypothetical protein
VMSSKTLIRQRLANGDKRLAYHGSHAPDVGACTPLGAKNDLGRTILPCLDVVCEMVADPTSISEVRNLHRDDLVRHVISAF